MTRALSALHLGNDQVSGEVAVYNLWRPLAAVITSPGTAGTGARAAAHRALCCLQHLPGQLRQMHVVCLLWIDTNSTVHESLPRADMQVDREHEMPWCLPQPEQVQL